jgi:hypothetical protein
MGLCRPKFHEREELLSQALRPNSMESLESETVIYFYFYNQHATGVIAKGVMPIFTPYFHL